MYKLLLVMGIVSGCGDDSGPDPTPDTPPPNEVTIEIFRNFPFVAGDTANEAEFVAVQDGDGAFVEAAGTNGVYKVPIQSDRFGVAVGCLDTAGSFVDIELVQQTVADGLSYQTVCKSRLPAITNLIVGVTNLAPGQRLRLRTARDIRHAFGDGTVDITLRADETELFGTLSDESANVLKLFRIDVAAKETVTIDVVADGAAPDTSGTFTMTPDDPFAAVRTRVLRPSGSFELNNIASPVGPTGRNYLMWPAALRRSDDLYRFSVTGDTGTTTRTVKSPGTLAFELPPSFSALKPELLETPYLHPVWTFTPTPSVLENQSYFLDAHNFFDPIAPVARIWFVTLSSRWVGDAPTVRYEFPDFTAMPGYAGVALDPSEQLDASIQRDETSGPLNVDGAVSTSSNVGARIGKFCGDGTVIAPEVCDPGEAGETPDCDSDCTAPVCGDEIVNFAAGEQCDPPDGKFCSAECTSL
jgi:hypothetical protein